MEVSKFLPSRGGILCEFKGGPHDRLGISFDDPAQVIVLDGHRYELQVKTWGEICPPERWDDFMNKPDEKFDWDYIYKGKEPSDDVS